jgi:hypothetical protein
VSKTPKSNTPTCPWTRPHTENQNKENMSDTNKKTVHDDILCDSFESIRDWVYKVHCGLRSPCLWIILSCKIFQTFRSFNERTCIPPHVAVALPSAVKKQSRERFKMSVAVVRRVSCSWTSVKGDNFPHRYLQISFKLYRHSIRTSTPLPSSHLPSQPSTHPSTS